MGGSSGFSSLGNSCMLIAGIAACFVFFFLFIIVSLSARFVEESDGCRFFPDTSEFVVDMNAFYFVLF